MAIGRLKHSEKPFWHCYGEIVADVKVKSFFEGSIDVTGCEGEISSYKTIEISATMSSLRSLSAERGFI